MNFRGSKGKNDSLCTGDDKAPANVNSLRKLFESNFKLSGIAKSFKSKNRCGQKNVDGAKPVAFDESRRFPKSGSKENEFGSKASPAGCYLNCKIENCCCKTFFRQYNETPIFRYRPLPRVPLQEHNGNSQFDRHRPERWSTTSCSSYNPSKQQQLCNLPVQHSLNHPIKSDPSRNKFYNINYEFYKSKSQEIFDETPVSAVSTKRLERLVSQTGRRVNLLEEIENSEKASKRGDGVDSRRSCASRYESGGNALPFQKTEASGFVSFTATTLSEGGYSKTAKNVRSSRKIEGNRVEERENVEDAVLERKNKIEEINGEPQAAIDSEEQNPEAEVHRIGGFGFKSRLPKLKNIGLRENSHPYNVKKPRLTVKGVKNRNSRNVKRRQKPLEGSSPLEGSTLCRSQTFSGYDNFAYRRSITDLQSKQPEQAFPVDDTENSTVNAAKSSADVRVPRPASISVIGVDDGPQFLDSRMSCYDWPVTSFYVEPGERHLSRATRGFSSTSNVDAEQSCLERKTNTVARKTNLKRYRSLSYLEEEFSDNNFAKNHRSLENVNKASATCEIQNLAKFYKPISLKKLQNIDVHVHALFAAVEHGHVEKAKTILESSSINVNSVNSDGLSPLDVSLLSNNKSLVKLLVSYGAQEGRKYYGSDMRNHLCHLLHEAESHVEELSGSLRLNSDTGQVMSNLTSGITSVTAFNGVQNRTFSIWERRAKGLKRMLTGFDQIRPPHPPSVVTVEVTSISSIMVYFTESDNENSSMTTKFKVQLSHDRDFSSLCGHYEVADTRQLKYHVINLCKGQSYYVRVASGNIKGYSAYKLSTPSFVVPSSWQDVAKKDSRFTVSLRDALESIFTSIVVDHPYLRNNAEMFKQGADLFMNQRRKKTSIKQLFTASSKFQKHLRRGVYLACLLYHDDKVLVTNDDFLPVIEVDENYPRKIHSDFHWFFKVSCNWNDVKWMKNDLDKLPNNSAVFRTELLQAAAHMQNTLGLQELGKLYYKMLRDVEGTIVISVINHIPSPKSVSVLNLRWLPLAKLYKKTDLVNSFPSNLSDILIASIPDQITYHQASKIELPRGLYLSYLKMRSSVESLEVLVPFRTPNILPHCKVRDNPHVTAEEWEWLVEKENLRESLASASYQQRLFIEQIVVIAKRLFAHMDIPDEEAVNHRLYGLEVIEVNEDINLIMIVPSAEISCSVSGQREVMLQRSHLLPFTVQAFEMIHFETYQPDLISLYSRLSCVIEMDIDLAQYNLRQAFNESEVDSAKCKLHELETLQAQLNTAWKNSKWLLDVISFARDRLAKPHIRMHELLSVHPKRALSSIEPNCVKTAKTRSSQADVGVGCRLSRASNEISFSKQNSTPGVSSEISSDTQNECNFKTSLALPIKRTGSEEIIGVPRSSSTSANKIRNCSRKPKRSSRSATCNTSSSSIHSSSLNELSASSSKVFLDHDSNIVDTVHVPRLQSGVIKVFAAHDIGLDSQIHFKFHVSPRTTAQDVVHMFVQQTNMTFMLKGQERPIFSNEDLSNFCLVAVDGVREFGLRDNFLLKQLEKLGTASRLYVRRRNSLLKINENDSQTSYV